MFRFAALFLALAGLTPTPRAPVTANADWTPVVQEFDGVPMVSVPPGCFQMGSSSDDVRAGIAERDATPLHEICFADGYWIDQTEVTQAQFAAFGGELAQERSFVGDDLPADGITWFEARDFCARRGARLPSEPEWEYAARGPDGLAYPWGDELVPENADYGQSLDMQPHPAGSFPDGVSWVGALDMAGGMFEWNSTAYAPYRLNPFRATAPFFAYPYDPDDGREDPDRTDLLRVLRGGSWASPQEYLRAASRLGNDPHSADFLTGFRCVLSSLP